MVKGSGSPGGIHTHIGWRIIGGIGPGLWGPMNRPANSGNAAVNCQSTCIVMTVIKTVCKKHDHVIRVSKDNSLFLSSKAFFALIQNLFKVSDFYCLLSNKLEFLDANVLLIIQEPFCPISLLQSSN